MHRRREEGVEQVTRFCQHTSLADVLLHHDESRWKSRHGLGVRPAKYVHPLGFSKTPIVFCFFAIENVKKGLP